VQKYLNPNKEKLKSKGVESVISRIMNLSEIDPTIDHARICETIQKEFCSFYHKSEPILHFMSKEKVY